MIRLETQRLVIRNWEDRDRDLFHLINSDNEVMRFFPFRRAREQADAMMDRLRANNEARGYGFAALELKASGKAIGFAGLHPDNIPEAQPEPFIEIGWRLAREHWGKGFVTEAGRGLLRFGFEGLGVQEIVSFAVQDNDRSIAVMKRLGFTHDPSCDFDHPRVPDTHPHLKRHVFYRLKREEWRRQIDGA